MMKSRIEIPNYEGPVCMDFYEKDENGHMGSINSEKMEKFNIKLKNRRKKLSENIIQENIHVEESLEENEIKKDTVEFEEKKSSKIGFVRGLMKIFEKEETAE